jgi:hypothetical protein
MFSFVGTKFCLQPVVFEDYMTMFATLKGEKLFLPLRFLF